MPQEIHISEKIGSKSLYSRGCFLFLLSLGRCVNHKVSNYTQLLSCSSSTRGRIHEGSYGVRISIYIQYGSSLFHIYSCLILYTRPAYIYKMLQCIILLLTDIPFYFCCPPHISKNCIYRVIHTLIMYIYIQLHVLNAHTMHIYIQKQINKQIKR